MPRVQKAGVFIRRNTNGTELNKSMQGDVLMVLGREAKKWGFPKGKKERRETVRQAAIRECREETGLVCAIEKDAQMYRIGATVYYEILFDQDTMGEISIQDTNEIMSWKWMPVKGLMAGDLVDAEINYDVRELIKGKIRKRRKPASPPPPPDPEPDSISCLSFETVATVETEETTATEDLSENLSGMKEDLSEKLSAIKL